MASFGVYLRNKRTQRGLTALQLCDLSNISQPYLSQLENDKIDNPSPDTLRKLSEALGISFTDILLARGYEVAQHDSTDGSVEKTQEILHYFDLIMKNEHKTLNGKFISNTDLQRMLSIIKLSFHNYFIDVTN